VSYAGHLFIIGPGLDEVLGSVQRIVLFDEEYADIYGDYVFLGYDVVAESISLSRADLVGMHNAAVLLDAEPSVVVCGEDPGHCLASIAAHKVYRDGADPGRAVDEASVLLEELYGARPRLSVQALTGLKGLHAALVALGRSGLSSLISLALSYGYGLGRLHYGESVSWLSALGASHVALLAGLLHFLVEGPGEPQELLERRLTAIGVEGLVELLGSRAEEALSILRDYIGHRETEEARAIALVESLGPGSSHVTHFEKVGREARVYCSVGEHGEPVKECVKAVGEASKLLPLKSIGVEDLRIIASQG
jgi:hypothetical protein